MNKWAILLIFLSPVSAQALHVRSVEAGIDLTTDKVAHLYDRVDETSAARYTEEIAATTNLPGPRITLINSPGGFQESGDPLIQLMEAEKKRGVKQVCVVMGGASSMAFNFLTHCDVRLAVREARFLVHKVYYSELPPGMKFTAANLRYVAKELETVDEPYRQANAKAMHMSLPDYDRAADLETDWTTAQLRAMRYLDGIVKISQ